MAKSDSEPEAPRDLKKQSKAFLNADLDLEDDFADTDDEGIHKSFKKSTNVTFDQDDDFDKSEDEEEEFEDAATEGVESKDGDLDELDENTSNGMVAKERIRNKKLKKLTPEKLAQEQKRIKKTGVCYLSRIPPYMKPQKFRSVMSRFGKIDRLFLKPEDNATHHKRVKYGGNKKKNYTEGWIEFVNKKDAKLCASTLNGNILGGKKTSYYHDDVINIKYLPGFKWFDLTQQIAKENESRQARLQLEISQQHKLNKSFIHNVEKSKMISGIEKKRKAKEESEGTTNDKVEVRRTFKQRKVTSTRADAKDELKESSKPSDKLNDVLSKVF